MDLYDLLLAPILTDDFAPEREQTEGVKHALSSGANQDKKGEKSPRIECVVNSASLTQNSRIAEIAIATGDSEKFTHELIECVSVYIDGAMTDFTAHTPCFVATNCGLAERRAKPVDKWDWLDIYAAKKNLDKGLWLVWLAGDWRGVDPRKVRKIKG